MGKFILRIFVPTLLTIALFTIAIFAVLLPALRENSLERKREMIRELTHSAWNLMANYEEEVQEGRLTREQAQAEAIRQLRNLHYGDHNKEYFWVNDLTPTMIAHPYRRDLEGQTLKDFTDPSGRKVFVEMIKAVEADGEGYVAYQWQDRGDPSRMVPKISFVKLFEPWGWVVGTGIYVDDVQQEIGRLTRHLGVISLIILLIAGGLMTAIAVESLRTEQKRRSTREALRRSEMRYRTLVESAGGSIFMALPNDPLYANASALALTGYTDEEIGQLGLEEIIEPTGTNKASGQALRDKLLDGQDIPPREAAVLVRKDGTRIHVMLAYSVILVGSRRGLIAVATDLTEQRAAEEAAGRTEKGLRQSLAQAREADLAGQRRIQLLEEGICSIAGSLPEDLFQKQEETMASAGDARGVAAACRDFKRLLCARYGCGLRPDLAVRLISRNTDTVVKRLVELTVDTLGPPPADFAFLAMGSQARHEQTLCTDQDNAIVFADPAGNAPESIRDYFHRLGERVCEGLIEAGYKRCEGDLMAANRNWVLSISEWEAKFRGWVEKLEARELMNTKIFFDFRSACGDGSLVQRLHEYVFECLQTHPRFFPQLARNMLFYEPPIGIFGNLQLKSTKGKSKGFDIKSAMVPLTDYGRLYALQQGIAAAGTRQRLKELLARETLDEQTARDAMDIFNSLMDIRLRHQVDRYLAGESPDNWIAPGKLTTIDRRVIKTALAQIRTLQRAMSLHFLGQMGGVP